MALRFKRKVKEMPVAEFLNRQNCQIHGDLTSIDLLACKGNCFC